MLRLGLGGFLFNRVVRWAKHADPQSKVVPLSLSAVDGENEVNRARRNRLYRRFGLRLVFQSADEVAGFILGSQHVPDWVRTFWLWVGL